MADEAEASDVIRDIDGPFQNAPNRAQPTGNTIMNDDNVIGAFSEEHAERLTGISRHQLKSWDRDGFFEPSYAFENRRAAYSRIYSFRDIVSLRVLNDLRNEKGVSRQHLKEVSRKLTHLGDAKWTATTLYVLGKRVVFEDPRTHVKEEIVSGQQVLDIPLRVVIASTRKAVQEMNWRGPAEVGVLIRRRFVAENQIVFAGTRIPVAAVKRYLNAGFSVEDVLSEFPALTRADVRAAKSYRIEAKAA